MCSANPGTEFVVANALAKWKKLEPNDSDFSQGSSKKGESRSWSIFLIWHIHFKKSKS